MDDQDAIRDLEREARLHDTAAERLENDAHHRRRMADNCRKSIEYIRKQRAT